MYFLYKYWYDHLLWFTETSVILCTNSEEVLSSLSQALDGVGHGLHSGTLDPLGLSFLQGINKVAGDSATTIIVWSGPSNCDGVLGNVCNPKF